MNFLEHQNFVNQNLNFFKVFSSFVAAF